MHNSVLRRLWTNQFGADTIEYALLGAFMAMAMGATMAPIVDATSKQLDQVVSTIQVAVTGAPEQPVEPPVVQSAQ